MWQLLLFIVPLQAATLTFNVAVLVQESSSTQLILPHSIYKRPVLSFADTSFITDLTTKGMDLWQDQINSLGGSSIQSDHVLYNITWFNVAPVNANSSYLTQQTINLMNDIVDFQKYGIFKSFISMLWPTSASEAISSKCETTKSCVVIYPLASDPMLYVCNGQSDCLSRGRSVGERRFDFTFSTMTDPAYNMQDFIRLMKFYQARSISIIAEDTTFGAAAMAGSVAIAQSLEIDVLFTNTLPSEGIVTLDDGLALVDSLLSQGNPDVFILFARPGQESTICLNLIQAMYQRDWMPKAFANGGPCTVGAESLLQKSGTGATNLYSYYTPPWDVSLRGQNYHVLSTANNVEVYASTETDDAPQTFAKLMKQSYQGEADNLLTLAVLGTACTLMIQKGVEASGTSIPTADDIRQGIGRINTASVIGQLEVDNTGRLVPGSQATAQIIAPGNVYTLVTPFSIGIPPTYPTPTWDERKENLGTFNDSDAEKIITALCIVSIIYVLCLATCIIYYRKNQIIRAATPEFCLLCLSGTILLLLTPFAWNLHSNTTGCVARIWLIQLGFGTIIWALIIKTYRIWRIFEAKILKVTRITTSELFLAFGIALILEVVFTIAWSITDGSFSSIVTLDPLRPSEDYMTCSNSNVFNIFAYIALAEKCVLILISAILGYKTRKVVDDFNESLQLGLMSYNLCFLLFIGLPIIISNVGGTLFNFWTRSLALILIAITTASLVILPKLVYIYSGHGNTGVQTSAGKATIAVGSEPGHMYVAQKGHSGNSTTLEQEVVELRKKVREMEVELRRKRATSISPSHENVPGTVTVMNM